MRILIVASSLKRGSGLVGKSAVYEHDQLLRFLRHYGATVSFVHPGDCDFLFDAESDLVSIFVGESKLPQFDYCIFRSIGSFAPHAAALAKSLALLGTKNIDPISRFSGAIPSKSSSSIRRFQDGVAPTTALIFSENSEGILRELQRRSSSSGWILKNSRGKQGKGLHWIQNTAETRAYISNDLDDALIVQPRVEIKMEFRYLTLNGEVLACAKKNADANIVARNSGNGVVFENTQSEPRIAKLIKKSGRLGLRGFDIISDREDKLYILEANFAPQWQAMESAQKPAIGKLIAKKIMDAGGTSTDEQAGGTYG